MNCSADAFLAVTACGQGPDAWPICIAWSMRDGEGRQMILRPAVDWPLTAWSKSDEAGHRLGLEELLGEGREPRDACIVLNAALNGYRVAAFDPQKDSFWLYRLYRAAGLEPSFTLCDFGELAPGVSMPQLPAGRQRTRALAAAMREAALQHAA